MDQKIDTVEVLNVYVCVSLFVVDEELLSGESS
jgi:hypothetical protein